ncbi:helix-turn-helix transcriptional regulator [Clostridium sp. KNHs216]|jgi:Predicted transcriptional regulator|uniref:helix-turn-helix domain-containing protein n=1 Tax=Clostridium sp. KNHs216 TaxID=1550235 RepID=UPI00056E1806|nr:helix-turn-helix transcriptional regulator [Clostridium sp. KNHs216]MBE6830944.1 helix-turn-helix transcriptional regulator [Oscillospiraceae bacterium]TQI67198.1 DNA-binding Xre family transcriptional regulator [Clostridium sp. KNHs216]
MILYTPFWETLKKRGVTTYALIKSHHISSSTLTRLRRNQPLSTVTINDLCRILDCRVQDIALYVANPEDERL